MRAAAVSAVSELEPSMCAGLGSKTVDCAGAGLFPDYRLLGVSKEFMRCRLCGARKCVLGFQHGPTGP